MAKKSIRERFYPYYRKLYKVNLWIEYKFTKAGIALLIAGSVAFIFGLNTQRTTLFQLFAIVFGLLTISAVSSFFFRPKLELKRNLPEFGIANKELHYSVTIKNNGDKPEKSIYLLEIPADPRPTLENFLATREPGEERRNKFDQKFSFYRWKWLIDKKTGAKITLQAISPIDPNTSSTKDLTITPQRRGVIHLEGIRIIYRDIFGLMNSVKTVNLSGRITILPEIFQTQEITLPGSRKYQKESTSLSSKTGDSMEFAGVREYMPGDQLKHIDWKLFAKHDEPVVRQFLDEFSSHFAIIIDNISQTAWSEPLEKAISAAASILICAKSGECAAGILYAAGRDFVFSEAGNEIERSEILKELASIESSATDFALFGKYIESLMPRFSGIICFMTSIDEERVSFIKKSKEYNIPAKFILIAEDLEKTKELIEKNNWKGAYDICGGSVPEILEKLG